MLELLDIHFNYLCSTTFQNEIGQCPIILRIVFCGERRDMFTGLYCFKDNWDKKDRKVLKAEKNAAGLNQNLELIQRKAVHVFDELKFIGDAFTIDIRKPHQKTGVDSIIPILPAAMRILLKYSPTNSVADFSWHVSANQKMNVGLKYIAKRAGITKKLHMHLARHTFATTVTLSNGVPIETVSKMLGMLILNRRNIMRRWCR